jgi:hypothetical protein
MMLPWMMLDVLLNLSELEQLKKVSPGKNLEHPKLTMM